MQRDTDKNSRINYRKKGKRLKNEEKNGWKHISLDGGMQDKKQEKGKIPVSKQRKRAGGTTRATITHGDKNWEKGGSRSPQSGTDILRVAAEKGKSDPYIQAHLTLMEKGGGKKRGMSQSEQYGENDGNIKNGRMKGGGVEHDTGQVILSA